MQKNLLTIVFLIGFFSGYAQIGINNPNPDTTSVMDMTSTRQGLLLPRMTSFQRRAISNPANSLLVFDTDESMFFFYDNAYDQGSPTDWTALSPFRFRDDLTNFNTGSGLYMRNIYTIPSFNHLGLGTQTPLNKLSVVGNVGIGDSTTIAPDNGLFVSGDVKMKSNLEVAENVTVDSVKASYVEGFGTIPVGGIIMWSGSTASIPDGWELCDGDPITDVESPINGQTLPNLSGRFIVGIGSNGTNSYTVKQTGGEDAHSLSVAELPAHDHTMNHGHTITDPGHTHGLDLDDSSGGGGLDDAGESGEGSTSTESAKTGITVDNHVGDTGSTGSGTAHENRPSFFALAYIMRIK